MLAAAAGAQTALDDTPPPAENEEKKILAQITENALKYGKDLPDFVCTKVTRQNVDPSGTGQQWKPTETVSEELSYINHKESYKTMAGNGKKAASPASSDGFGNLLAWIFDPTAQADIKWNSWTTLNKRRTYVFAYKVLQPKSQFTVASSKTRVTVAFAGLVWADVDTGVVMRVTATGQSPAGFPVQGVTLDVSYAFTKVDEREFVLPVKSDFRAKDGKSLVWNEAEFRRYRKPGVD